MRLDSDKYTCGLVSYINTCPFLLVLLSNYSFVALEMVFLVCCKIEKKVFFGDY